MNLARFAILSLFLCGCFADSKKTIPLLYALPFLSQESHFGQVAVCDLLCYEYLAFQSDRDGNLEIYRRATDRQSGQATLLNLTNLASDEFSPALSRIGGLLYAGDQTGDAEIYHYGENPTNLSGNPAVDTQPSWSLDGSRIAFVSDRDGNREVYMMNADGTEQTNLTQNAASDESSPSWSPDGNRIAFESDRDGNREVYVMNADGTEQTNLTQNASTDENAHFALTGIFFASNRDGNYEIYSMDADGSNLKNETNHLSSDSAPTVTLGP